MKQPFTEKYRPRLCSEIQGHTKAVEQVLNYVSNYASQKKKGLLLYGAAGTGKTSVACAVASELGLELVEVNASDARNKDAIMSRVGGAMQQRSLFGGEGKLILFDEVDGLSGTKDRGGIQALVDLMKTSQYPVLLTANNPWDKKFSTLRKHVEMVELGALAYTSILPVLKRVAQAEGIAYEEEALKALARRAGGDLRGALTDLQTLGADLLIDSGDLEALGERRKAESMHNALQRVFKGSDPLLAKKAVDAVDEDIDEVFLWVEENIPREYTKAADVQRATDALSQADVFRGRIRRWQHWRYLVYVIDFMTAGVALAKDEKYRGFTRFQRTTRILKLWRANQAAAKKDAVARKVAEFTHTSTRTARSQLPFFARLLARDDGSLQDVLALAEDEKDWLVQKLS
jgi:replication factor C large subunit